MEEFAEQSQGCCSVTSPEIRHFLCASEIQDPQIIYNLLRLSFSLTKYDLSLFFYWKHNCMEETQVWFRGYWWASTPSTCKADTGYINIIHAITHCLWDRSVLWKCCCGKESQTKLFLFLLKWNYCSDVFFIRSLYWLTSGLSFWHPNVPLCQFDWQ